MTFYLRPIHFTTPSNFTLEQNSLHFIKILVDKIERRVYQFSSENMRQVYFSKQEDFIKLSSADYIVEVKLYRQDKFRNLLIVAETKFEKEDVIRYQRLKEKVSSAVVLYDVELNPSEQRNALKFDEMTKGTSFYSIQLQIKLDKYKKTIGRLNPNLHFVQELRFLDKNLEQLERGSVNRASLPKLPDLKKEQFPLQEHPTQQKKRQSTKENMIRANYIGSCYSKNMFSFLDRDKGQHVYSIVEPSYQGQNSFYKVSID